MVKVSRKITRAFSETASAWMSFRHHMHMGLLLMPYAVQFNTKIYDLYTTFVSDSFLLYTLAFLNGSLHAVDMF